MKILVAGIGNIFQGDDAFGCEVAKLLLSRIHPACVQIVDFGIRSLDLTYALLDGADLTILVDAVPFGGNAGTIYTIEPSTSDLAVQEVSLDAHTMDPVAVLRMVEAMGGRLGRILLVGCEPEDLGGEDGVMGLTPAVAAAVEPAAEIVQSLIERELEELKYVA